MVAGASALDVLVAFIANSNVVSVSTAGLGKTLALHLTGSPALRREPVMPMRRQWRCQCDCWPFGGGNAARHAISAPSLLLALPLNRSLSCWLIPFIVAVLPTAEPSSSDSTTA